MTVRAVKHLKYSSQNQSVIASHPLRRRSIYRTGLRLGLVLLVIVLMLWVTAGQWLPAIGFWLYQSPQLQTAEAIVVLDGEGRGEHGIELFQRGLASEFWYTGHVPLPAQETTPAQMIARQAEEQGIAAHAIHLLATTSTWEDGIETAALVRERDIDSIIVVTSWYHSRRALCVIKHHLRGSGVQVLYSAPAIEEQRPANWWQNRYSRRHVLSELAKIGYYQLRYGVSPWGC